MTRSSKSTGRGTSSGSGGPTSTLKSWTSMRRRARRCARTRTCAPRPLVPWARPLPRRRATETGCTSTRSPCWARDAGDQRFHPDNVIWDAREANIIAIVDKHSGKIVWKLGPRYDGNDAERKLGWIIGQHHAHFIPRGLPGEGNLLVYDNGG